MAQIHYEWMDEIGIGKFAHFSLREYIEGDTLKSLWSTMNWQEKTRAADQVSAWLKQLRNLTANYMGRLDEQPLVDHVMFNTLHFDRQGPFYHKDDLWAAMEATLQSPYQHCAIPAEALAALGRKMPDCWPATFTHGDLSLGNIIMRDGEVVGLLDWRWSGLFPSWWEHTKLSWGHGVCIDPQWFHLLEERMDKYPDAVVFHEQFQDLVRYIASNKQEYRQQGQETILRLLSEQPHPGSVSDSLHS